MNTQQRQRKRFRFSLLAMLLIVSIIGSIIGWIGSLRIRYAQQHQAATALDGLALTKFWWNSDQKSSATFDRSRLLRFRRKGPAVIEIIHATHVPFFESMTGQRNHTEVVSIELQHLEVFDKDLVHLRCLPNLQHLNLDNTAVTDDGVRGIKPSKKLKYLCLGQTNISDDALKELEKFSEIESLDLWVNNVTDVGLQYLPQLEKLKNLNVCMTNVTEAGVHKLQQSLPNCQVWWDGDEAFKRINRLPAYSKLPQDYDPVDAIESINYFHALGKNKTIDVMKQYLRFAPGEASSVWQGDYCQTRLLSLMSVLFVPQRPEMGIPQQAGLTTNVPIEHGWPFASIQLESDIPFAVVDNRPEFGPIQNYCRSLVSWVEGSCDLRKEPLQPVTDPRSAAESLIEQLSKSYKTPRTSLERILMRQAERMIDHIEDSDAKVVWNPKNQRYENAIQKPRN